MSSTETELNIISPPKPLVELLAEAGPKYWDFDIAIKHVEKIFLTELLVQALKMQKESNKAYDAMMCECSLIPDYAPSKGIVANIKDYSNDDIRMIDHLENAQNILKERFEKLVRDDALREKANRALEEAEDARADETRRADDATKDLNN